MPFLGLDTATSFHPGSAAPPVTPKSIPSCSCRQKEGEKEDIKGHVRSSGLCRHASANADRDGGKRHV